MPGALQPRNYNFKKEGAYASLQLPQGLHYGLIAQDLEKVLPNLVKESTVTIKDYKTSSEDGTEKSHEVSFKAVNYTELIPIMIKGMQEQAKENEQLKKQNADLEIRLAKLEVMMNAGKSMDIGQQQNVGLYSASLAQNVPNPPVGNATTIRYSVPKEASKAQMLIADISGKAVKQINLSSGKGSVNLNTQGLSAGTYSYTLLVDGKVMETKKMTIN